MSEFTSAAAFFRDNYQILNEELLAELEKITEVWHVEPGRILMVPGEVPSFILFQAEGISRGFFVDDRGHEHTDCFGGQYALPLMPSGALGEKSEITIEETDPGIILALPVNGFRQLLELYAELQEAFYRILAGSAKANSELRRVLYLYNAGQRYDWFVRRFPAICDRVSQKHAASFLNMSAETYCRIRKERAKQREAAQNAASMQPAGDLTAAASDIAVP